MLSFSFMPLEFHWVTTLSAMEKRTKLKLSLPAKSLRFISLLRNFLEIPSPEFAKEGPSFFHVQEFGLVGTLNGQNVL